MSAYESVVDVAGATCEEPAAQVSPLRVANRKIDRPDVKQRPRGRGRAARVVRASTYQGAQWTPAVPLREELVRVYRARGDSPCGSHERVVEFFEHFSRTRLGCLAVALGDVVEDKLYDSVRLCASCAGW
jgi:hypothetical protein